MKLKSFILIAFLILATVFLVIFLPHKKDTTKYNLIVPSRGNFIQTQAIELQFDNDKDLAMGVISDSSLTTIRQNQNVILRDKEKQILPLGGKIAFVRKSPEVLDILVALPKGTDTDLLSTDAHIITMEVNTLELLPKNIIQTDENGEKFIWTAEKSEDQYEFKKTSFSSSYENDFYVAPATTLKSDTLILANPDENISEDKSFKARTVVFSPPKYNPIYTAWLNYGEQKLLDDQTQMAKNLEECLKRSTGNAPSSPQTGDISAPPGEKSCGGGGIISAEQIFANIAKEGANSNACGANSCGQ